MTTKLLQADSFDEESPEADDAWFARSRPAAQVLPELFDNTAHSRLTVQHISGQHAPGQSEVEEISTTLPSPKLTR